MATEADDAVPPPPKKSGGFMGMLVNGLGVFVLTLAAVIVGGSINAKLHPLPDLRLDKDGKITAIVPVAAAPKGAEGGGAIVTPEGLVLTALHLFPLEGNIRPSPYSGTTGSRVADPSRPATRRTIWRCCESAASVRNASASCAWPARIIRSNTRSVSGRP